MIRNRSNTTPYITKDGSTIWELYHPESSPIKDTSVAEAYLEPGHETERHIHRSSQEVYYILAGQGRIVLDGQPLDVKEGDAILMKPGTVHNIRNTGTGGLRFLCICTPPYSHSDTYMR